MNAGDRFHELMDEAARDFFVKQAQTDIAALLKSIDNDKDRCAAICVYIKGLLTRLELREEKK